MNMAFIGSHLLCFLVFISARIAKASVKVDCKAENVGQFSQQSLLECIIHTRQGITDTTILVVTWEKLDTKEIVLAFGHGTIMQEPGYSFAEPSWNDKNMNVSLLITNTAVEHEGNYRCEVVTDSGDNSNHTSLKVTAKYSVPTMQYMRTDSTLTCESDGGYPEGRIGWFDEHNKEWTENSEMVAERRESRLFHLSSTLTLQRKSTSSKYSCVVFNASGGKDNEATFNIPTVADVHKGEGPVAPAVDPTSKIVAPVVVIGSLIVGLLMALLVYRRRTRQNRRHSAAPLMGEHLEVRTGVPPEVYVADQDTDTKYQDDMA